MRTFINAVRISPVNLQVQSYPGLHYMLEGDQVSFKLFLSYTVFFLTWQIIHRGTRMHVGSLELPSTLSFLRLVYSLWWSFTSAEKMVALYWWWGDKQEWKVWKASCVLEFEKWKEVGVGEEFFLDCHYKHAAICHCGVSLMARLE